MDQYIVPILIAIAVFVVLFAMSYVKAPPDEAYIITGLRKKKKILIGRAGFRVPFLERVDRLSLKVMQVDVKTSEAVPTNEFINVTVDGVSNIKISSRPDLLERAAEALLGMRQPDLIKLAQQVLEGNMREIIGTVSITELVQKRQIVAESVRANIEPDMAKLGIEVVNFNIQTFTDKVGTIENMGIDNVEQIRKAAQIAKANAQRDITIAEANAREEANRVKVETDQRISEQDTALSIRKAELKTEASVKQAEADASYDIQKEIQRRTVEVASVEADIARREQEAVLAEREVSVQEKKLDAEIRKKADAERYRAEQLAAAELAKRQRAADAQRYEQEQEALARKAVAEAEAFAKLKQAEGIKAIGDAEAEAIEKKAEAQKKMGEASVLEMVLAAYPEIAKNVAEPLTKTDRIVMYGDGGSTKLVKDVMGTASQVIEGLKESTGIDISSLLAGYLGGKAASSCTDNDSSSDGDAE